MSKRHLNQTSLLNAPEYFGGIELDSENEWVKLAKLIPWHEFEDEYRRYLHTMVFLVVSINILFVWHLII